MSVRWLVERKRNDFEDVGAKHVRVESGCLVFRDDLRGEPTVIIAAGHWETCTLGEEE